jgi:hypothetical protein
MLAVARLNRCIQNWHRTPYAIIIIVNIIVKERIDWRAMELDASLSWLALALTPGLALSGRLLEEFGSPEEVFRAPLPRLEGGSCPRR